MTHSPVCVRALPPEYHLRKDNTGETRRHHTGGSALTLYLVNKSFKNSSHFSGTLCARTPASCQRRTPTPQPPRAHWRPQQNGRRPHAPTAGQAPPARNYSSQQPPRPAPRSLPGIAVLPPPTFGRLFCRGASVNANQRSPRPGGSRGCLIKETKKK